MKRLLLTNILSLWAVPLALATTNYINSGIVSVMSPPQIAPQIDASNFVNYGTFDITNAYVTTYQPALPYESWNTRNWTNANLMAGDSGFRFDYYDSVGQTNGWSANFQNAGNVNPSNAYVFGASYLLIAATNVVDKGTLSVSGPGLLTVSGETVDLTRGTLGGTGNDTNDLANSLDLYWAIDGIGFYSNVFNTIFVPNNFYTPTQAVQTIDYQPAPPHYDYFLQSLSLTNAAPWQPLGWTAYLMITGDANNPYLTHTEVLFLSQTNPAITTTVRFWPAYAFTGGGFPNGPYWYENTKVVQFQTLVTNRAGAITTNILYFADTNNIYVNGNMATASATLVQTIRPYLNTPYYAATFRPSNFGITHLYPTFASGVFMSAQTNVDFYDTFSIWNVLVETWADSYGATITANPFSFDPSISGATYTNMPGRVQITATKTLNLERTIMDGESYLSLQCTNHFIGSSNAQIIAPFSDISLASTNGTMTIANLIAPTVPRMCGEIDAWSGHWITYLIIPPATTPVTSNLFRVTVIESHLAQQTVSQIQNLTLSSTNLFISDALNVFGSLLLNAQSLTITTNAVNAPTPNGELNLSSGNLTWSASLPVLQNLTNYGKISSVNSIYFAGARTPPWFSGTYDEPYLSFVTHGLISSVGCSIWADYVEASGTNNTGIGPLTLQADSVIVTNGAFLTTDADITVTCGSLLISNQVLQAGRSISLTVTNYLDDGSLSNSVEVITNQNTWAAGGGIDLWLFPSNGASLLATTVTNTAFPNAEVDNYWAGKDYGCWPSGFVNNAALGRLILDGQDDGSLFAFFRTGLTNALYVDLLVFEDAATNFVSSTVPETLDASGVNLDKNFTIYYGDAVVDGHSIAEKLDGGYGVADTNGGRFRWVSNYNTGFFSSTNVVYTDGSVHQLNRALVYSCDINSNGQPYPPTGGANASCDGSMLKPNPVPVLTPATLVLKAVYTNHPTRSVVLSWDTLPLASNYLYSSSSLLPPGTNWQLVTNFLSDATIGGRVTNTYPIRTNGALYYRVSVQSP
jgi:hypothetical protein